MNILAVNWQDIQHPQAGGAEIHLFEIMSRLVRRGHRVRLVCAGWPGAPPAVDLDGIAVRRAGTRSSFALVGRRAVRRELRREPPDILVEDINKLPLFLAGLSRVPLAVIVPHLFGSAAFAEASWFVAAVVWLSERPIPWAYRRAGFHAISASTRDDLVRRGIPRERVRVIHPGVDAARFIPDPSTPRVAPPRFLYVGRLKRYKGVENAVRALALVRRARPDVTLDIAGDGDDRTRLEAVVEALALGSAVRFLGFVNEADKIQLFRRATANLFPSPKEGWGMTIMEAAACGTPSIASDSPGLRDSVRHGESGYLVPHGDPDAMAQRMIELAGDPDLVERLGQRGRRIAESMSWEETAERTEAHLESLVREG